MRIKEAKDNGFSIGGALRLRQMADKHKLIFKIQLRSGGSAIVPAMKFTWNPVESRLESST